jgi:PAS domain S-box-containing protein
VDCNEQCARIFGFRFREEMLEHTAWEFYFDRAEREAMINQLRMRGSCPPEQFCFRRHDGEPVWVLATRTVVDVDDTVPTILQGTLIDITSQKKAEVRQRDANRRSFRMTIQKHEKAQLSALTTRLSVLLNQVSKALGPRNLGRINRSNAKECLLALEELKMLIAESELLNLSEHREAEPQ